jgi:Tfp pilus assembly protein PilW
MLIKKKLKKIKKNYLQKKKGFTLVETLVAMLLFTLIVVMVSGVFMTFLKNYVVVRNLQRSTESAQFAMNLMAKTIRTSQVANLIQERGATQLDLFDFSQNVCLRYASTADTITVTFTDDINPVSITDCHFVPASLHATQQITAPEVAVSGSFTIVPSIGPNLGAVSIILTAAEGNAALLMQTTVSLRNFGII